MCGGNCNCFNKTFGKNQPRVIVNVCVSLIQWFLNVLFQLTAQQRYSDYMRSIWDQIKAIDQSTIFDEKLYRQVKHLASIGPSALPADQLDRVGFWHVMRFYNCVIDWRWIVWLKYNRIINDMLAIYNSATICGFEQPFQCSLRLQPHLREVSMEAAADIESHLNHAWLVDHGQKSRLGWIIVGMDRMEEKIREADERLVRAAFWFDKRCC